jgi:hypothetical protein
MDGELKQYLEALEAHLTRTDESLKAMEDRLIERIRDTETTLLTEFHKWASPVDSRVRALSSMVRTFDADLEYIQDRLKKLENRPTGT